MRKLSDQDIVCGPVLSLMPYSSKIGMFKLMKYSKVSLVIGAAPVKHCLQRSNPREARTLLKTMPLASVKPQGTEGSLEIRDQKNICHSHIPIKYSKL